MGLIPSPLMPVDLKSFWVIAPHASPFYADIKCRQGPGVAVTTSEIKRGEVVASGSDLDLDLSLMFLVFLDVSIREREMIWEGRKTLISNVRSGWEVGSVVIPPQGRLFAIYSFFFFSFFYKSKGFNKN